MRDLINEELVYVSGAGHSPCPPSPCPTPTPTRTKNNNGWGNGPESGPAPGNSGARNPNLLPGPDAGGQNRGVHPQGKFGGLR